MAGVKGQPTPTPKDLPSAAPKKSMLDSYATPEGSALESYSGDTPQEVPEIAPEFESPWYTAALPAVGGIVGGIGGAAAGGVGAIPGAGLGGLAGQSLRELIEVEILGKPRPGVGQYAKDVATAGLEEGLGQAVGMGIVKGAKAAGTVAKAVAKTPAGQKIAEISGGPLNYVKDTVKSVQEGIEKPFLEIITKKSSPMNAEQSGNQVKKLFLEDLQQRFDGRSSAYYDKFNDLLPKNGKTFVEKLDAVAPEKLVEKMWDQKNAEALRTLQQEVPKVFDQVAQARMNQILRKSSPEGVLDLFKVRREIYKMPEATRALLVSGDDLKVMNKVLDSPRLKRLGDLEKMGEEFVGKWASRVYEMTRIGAEAVPKVANTVVGRQAIGKAATPFISPLANVIGGEPAPVGE